MAENNKKRKSKVEINPDISSVEARMFDFNRHSSHSDFKRLRNAEAAYAPCLNPYNVKLIVEIAIEENKNPLWELMFEDVLEKAEKAIIDKTLMKESDVLPIHNFSTDTTIRFSCFDDYLDSLSGKLEISPMTVQKVLAYAPKRYHNKLLMEVPWDTEIPVGNKSPKLLMYALQKSSTEIVLKKFQEISRETVKEILSTDTAIKLRTSENGDQFSVIDVDSFVGKVVYTTGYKITTDFLLKFGDLLSVEQKIAFLQNSNSELIVGFNKAEKSFKETGKFLAKDFSKDAYNFVKTLHDVVSKKEYAQYLKNEHGFYRYNGNYDFITPILNSQFIKDKLDTPSEEITKSIKPAKVK